MVEIGLNVFDIMESENEEDDDKKENLTGSLLA